jgi:hypothetical protein
LKAWLVTWEAATEAVAVADPLAAILPSRWSADRVAKLAEILYARATGNASEVARYATPRGSNPYPGVVSDFELVTCGHNPFLYARKVTALHVALDTDADLEVISWTEPDCYRYDAAQHEVEYVGPGRECSLRRQASSPLSAELDLRLDTAEQAGFDRTTDAQPEHPTASPRRDQ